MNQLANFDFTRDAEDKEEELLLSEDQPFVLKKLRQKHKDVCSFFAQGLKNTEIAAITGYTKEYIGVLIRQQVCVDFIARLNESIGVRLELTHGLVVDAVVDVLDNGNAGEKMKAARLHAELTKRIGNRDVAPPSAESSVDRLTRLAERLTYLVMDAKQGRVINAEFRETSREVQGDGKSPQSDLRQLGSGADGESGKVAEDH